MRYQRLSWNMNVKYTWLFLSGASVAGWSGTKKSFSKIHPTKRQGRQHYQPLALANIQCDGKTNSPTGKRKTLVWDVKQEWATRQEHVLLSFYGPCISVGYIFFSFFS